MTERTPQDVLRDWLPHALMLALLALSGWLLARVFAPISDPVLLAAALAALTYPILFEPLNHLARRRLTFLDDAWRRTVVAAIATLAFILILVSPLVLMLLTTLEHPGDAFTVLYGLARRDPERIQQVAIMGEERVQAMLALYPKIPLQPGEVRAFLEQQLTRSDVGRTFLDFLLHGTGGFIAQLALALTSLFYFYDFGPRVVSSLLAYTPLTPHQRVLLRRRFQSAIYRLMTDTLGTALLKGLCMGAIAWIIADFNFFIVVAVTTFISLLPVIGFTFVWLPLASLLWAQQHRVDAICLATAALASSWLVHHLGERLTLSLDHRRTVWLSFLLFLSLIGGLIAFGVKGFVVGPMAVVFVVVLGSFWLPLYGIGDVQ
ncbi:MAG: AI-2E family transporter, partial [Planctomycetes bacterium]|nr:AI-2E family transporter [Planctomycetota bacterium]